MFQAARTAGPIFWIALAYNQDRLLPAALPEGLAERLHLVETDLLWATEEALRSPAVALVIAAPARPLSLTVGRRLQLAAEAGLMLIQQGSGSHAAETRSQCESLPGPEDSTRHRWTLIKNIKGTIGPYDVNWDGSAADRLGSRVYWLRSGTKKAILPDAFSAQPVVCIVVNK